MRMRRQWCGGSTVSLSTALLVLSCAIVIHGLMVGFLFGLAVRTLYYNVRNAICDAARDLE